MLPSRVMKGMVAPVPGKGIRSVSKNTIGFLASVTLLFGAYYFLSTRSLSQIPEAGKVNAPVATFVGQSSERNASSVSGTGSAATSNGSEASASPASISLASAPAADFRPEAGPARLTLENDDIGMEVAARGGCVERTTLKKFTQTQKGQDPFQLLEKLEACKGLGIKIGSLDLRELPALLTQISKTQLVIEQRSSGYHFRRTLEIGSSGYQGSARFEIFNLDAAQSQSLFEIEIGATSTRDGASSFLGFDQSKMRHLAYYSGGKRHETVLKFESAPRAETLLLEPKVNLSWAEAGGTYFMFALIPDFSDAVGLRFERQPFNMQPNRQSPPERTIYEGWIQHSFDLAKGSSRSWNYKLYMGPKDLDDLRKAGHDLVESINYGFFQIVAWPMFKALHFIEGIVGNWGIAILVLTLLIRLLFFPLTKKSFVAGKKMQKLQPRLNELKELYKDDKQKQQQEMMAMMSKEGVNPLGGCLPILPQIPVFFGLNSVLMHTFDLRHAPFVLWIQDLSTHDPYYISPAIMAGLMYLQQRLIPMPSMDPTQAKMMRFLPLIFAVFMITYPSGLVVYIVTSTLFSIAQQQFMMKTYKDLY